jgi:proline iminopeptidase
MKPDLHPVPREGTISLDHAELYVREIGQWRPMIILHGGPDFNQAYLLPELDRLAASFRLIYYDQRGRGKSAGNVRPVDVNIESEIEDLEGLRRHFRLESFALLGHSWGGLLALEYAIRHPDRVSHLILMNTAPASHHDYMLLRQERRKKSGDDLDRMKALAATARYREGDLETDAEYYRIHFGATIRQPEHLDRLVHRLRLNFTQEGIVKAREIEQRLMEETWLSSEYNLLPKLELLRIPTLVIYGEYDFIPEVCVAPIARAIPGARWVMLKECGHFAYLECPEATCQEISDFIRLTLR